MNGTDFQALQSLPPPETFAELREQHRIWADHNFPAPQPWHPALGVIEELGELSHAVLKKAQGIRGTEAEHTAAIVDAVADVIVFLADFANQVNARNLRHSWRRFADLCEEADPDEHPDKPWFHIASATSLAGKLAEGLANGMAAAAMAVFIEGILDDLGCFCKLAGIDYHGAVNKTWTEVRVRDWRADPVAGSASANWEAWKAELCRVAEDAYGPGGPIVQCGEETWRDAFDLGMTPAEAHAEQMSEADQ